MHVTNIQQINDGGANNSEQTDIYVTGALPGKTFGASGLVGVVTGAILGQPFSVIGGDTPTLVLDSTFLAGDSAYSVFTAGPAESFIGGIGGSILTAPSGVTSLAGQASGTAALGGFTGAGLIGGGYDAASTATHASGCLGLGANVVGYTTCVGY